jgi:aldose 1-epimerase
MRRDRLPFGKTRAGIPVERFVLESSAGLVAEVMTYGATLLRLLVPDGTGDLTDVVLGFDTLPEYESAANPYFGCIVGRCANRIARGELEIAGERFELTRNEGRHHLHGGRRGLSRVVWEASACDGRSVRLRHESLDGDEGYPGRLAIEVTYALDGNELRIDYAASADRATPVSPSHHSYFDLSGEGSILDHRLWIDAARFTPVDAEHIPTGAIEPVAGTALDFTRPRRIGERIGEPIGETGAFGGYDHNFVLDARPVGAERELVCAARLEDPRSIRTMEVWTSAPGLQVYTGNHLAGLAGKAGRVYGRHAGLCLEAQGFPDAVHHTAFPSVLLEPGEDYRHTTVYRFGS